MKLLLASLCAFIVLCILIGVTMAWPDAGYWIRYYDVEIIVAVVTGAAIGPMLYDWAANFGKGGAA